MGEATVHALRGMDLVVQRSEFIVLLGFTKGDDEAVMSLIIRLVIMVAIVVSIASVAAFVLIRKHGTTWVVVPITIGEVVAIVYQTRRIVKDRAAS